MSKRTYASLTPVSRLVLLMLLILVLRLPAIAQAQPQSQFGAKNALVHGPGVSGTSVPSDLASKRVLILHSFAYAQPAYKIIDAALIECFVASGLNFNNLYFEFLDLARNPGQEYRHELAKIFRNKFKGRKLDLVLALHQEALQFLLKEGQDVYPEGPIISILGDDTFREHSDLKRPIIHLPFTIDVISTAKGIFSLQPDTRKILVIAGSSALDRRFEDLVMERLKAWRRELDVESLPPLPLSEILKKVANLPAGTSILYTTIYADSTGKTYIPAVVVRTISKSANAPVFGLYETLVGDNGIVGGTILNHRVEGERAVQLAMEILHGKFPEKPLTILPAPLVPMFDWPQLKRWGFKESAVSANAIVLNKPVSPWERYKFYIIAAVAFFLLETALIIFLVIQRRRKKVAEESLRHKTEELDQFFDVSLDLLGIANTEGYFLRLNPAAETILGYTREELMAKRLLDFVHPDDLDRTREAISTLSSQQKVFSFENRYCCRDGTYRWLEWSSSPAGKLIYAAARDVTERKLAQQALVERLRFEGLLSELSARFVNILPDRVDSEIDYGLRQILEFFRVDRVGLMRSLPDRSGHQVTHGVYGENVPSVPLGVKLPRSLYPWAFEKLAEEHGVVSFSRLDDLPPEANVDRQTYAEWGIRSALDIPIITSGSAVHVIVINSVKSERVWPEEFIPRLRLLGEIFVNALERKQIRLQLEERLRFEALISNLSSAFVNVPPDEVESQINKGLRSITEFFDADRCSIGLFSEGETQLARAFEYHSPEAEAASESLSREQMPWYMDQLIRGNPVVMNRIEDFPPEAEKERQLCLAKGMKSLLSIPLLSEGKTLGSCALVSTRAERAWPEELVKRFRLVSEVFGNVLERRRAEVEAFHARRELLRLERLSRMGELTASLAHELNQPLTSILSNARAALRFIQSDRLDIGELKEILQDIASDDKRAGDIIRSLRSMLKPDEGVVERVQINDVLAEVVSLFHSEAIIRNLTIEMNFAHALPPVYVDRVQMQQVLVNLMMNAAQSMERGGVGERKIILQSHAVDNRAVRVGVRDFGPGVEEKELGKIFEPFFTTKRTGLGMGLSLSRSIVEAHGGHIWAENNPDQGATFFIELPRISNE